jgi:hypothetical protein
VPKEKESLPTGDVETYVGRDVEANALRDELELKDRKIMQTAEMPDIPAILDRRHEIATPKVARPAPVNDGGSGCSATERLRQPSRDDAPASQRR